jgi:hypothetical protein
MKNLKVGDKVYCVKTFKKSINSDMIFEENKTYKITAIMNNLHVKLNLNEKIDICQIDYKLNFYFTKYSEYTNFYFYDYFITLKELIKQKLQKLQLC